MSIADTTGNLRGIVVEKDYDNEPLFVRGRRKDLTYVLEELLINSWKEVERGESERNECDLGHIRERIHLHRDGDHIVCLVADDGPGIPASLHGTIFKRHAKARHGGTGLGLYIIRRIIEDHGGSISLVNEAKPSGYEGACFEIMLPLNRVAS
jgi:two-component system nitrogen regulation sensor histidine kinase NtrY